MTHLILLMAMQTCATQGNNVEKIGEGAEYFTFYRGGGGEEEERAWQRMQTNEGEFRVMHLVGSTVCRVFSVEAFFYFTGLLFFSCQLTLVHVSRGGNGGVSYRSGSRHPPSIPPKTLPKCHAVNKNTVWVTVTRSTQLDWCVSCFPFLRKKRSVLKEQKAPEAIN